MNGDGVEDGVTQAGLSEYKTSSKYYMSTKGHINVYPNCYLIHAKIKW